MKHAALAAEVFKERGAFRVVENRGHDVKGGEATFLPVAVKAGENEAVVFPWIESTSREVRDAAM